MYSPERWVDDERALQDGAPHGLLLRSQTKEFVLLLPNLKMVTTAGGMVYVDRHDRQWEKTVVGSGTRYFLYAVCSSPPALPILFIPTPSPHLTPPLSLPLMPTPLTPFESKTHDLGGKCSFSSLEVFSKNVAALRICLQTRSSIITFSGT